MKYHLFVSLHCNKKQNEMEKKTNNKKYNYEIF